METADLDQSLTFISLDVISLYPNIDFGVKTVMEYAENHWDKIKNLDLTINTLQKCLSFICYNYEIILENETYLQIKGCPMGAHFAPAFAIL